MATLRTILRGAPSGLGPALYDPVLRSTRLEGNMEIYRVVDAVNSLPIHQRRAMIEALKLSAPHVRWITLHDGRLSVA